MESVATKPENYEDDFTDVPPENQRNCCVSCLNSWGFYFSQAFLEIKHRTCGYIWGFLSILIVCMVTSVVISVDNQFPVVVLMLAEGSSAEQDLVIRIGDWNKEFGLDYIQAEKTCQELGSDYTKMSPRVNTTVHAYGTEGHDFYAELIAIDTNKEKAIELGRLWDFSPMAKGTCILTSGLAYQLKVEKGDSISFELSVNAFSPIALSLLTGLPTDSVSQAQEILSKVIIPMKVADIAEDSLGKCIEEEVIFVEIDNLWEHVVDSLPANFWSIPGVDKDEWKEEDLRHYVNHIIFSYTSPRHEAYLTFDTDELKKELVDWASTITHALSFNDLEVAMPVGSSFSMFSMLGMMINLISLIVVVVLACISILLIYSLLQISVDSRIYELGILRMVGLTRWGVIGSLLAQALLYALPGWVLGVGSAFGVNAAVIKVLINATDVPLDQVMPFKSVLIATLIAFGISVLASIIPIRTALGQNLHDSIDINHSKNQVVVVSIERSEDLRQPWAILVGGILFAGIGGGVYIIFPLALVSMDLMLLGSMLFVMLMLILGALVMICINFEYLFEKIFATVFLFWESRAVRELALKNLGAHRLRNRKTTVLYSVSLAYIVFVNVMTNLLANTAIAMISSSHGGDIDVFAYKPPFALFAGPISQSRYDPEIDYLSKPLELDAITDRFSDIVKNVAWVSHELEAVYSQPTRTQIANIGRSHAYYHRIFAATPNLLDYTNQSLVDVVGWKESGDSIIKSLYTNRQDTFTTVLSNGLKEKMGADPGDQFLLNIIPISATLGASSSFLSSAAEYLETTVAHYNISSNAYIQHIPFFNTPANTISATDVAECPVSIPTYLSMLSGDAAKYENIKWNHMFITVYPKCADDRYEALVQELKGFREDQYDAKSVYTVWSFRKMRKNFGTALLIIDIIFIVITIVVMVLCFFSLMSSMHTNVMEQGKEIGIMRALGLTRMQILRVFVEEAFILVITATIMGLITGMIIGYLLTSQMSSMMGLPTPLYFPWQIALIMLAVAVVTSILSALQPTLAVTSKSIVTTIKTV